jgi:hypothetical protein
MNSLFYVLPAVSTLDHWETIYWMWHLSQKMEVNVWAYRDFQVWQFSKEKSRAKLQQSEVMRAKEGQTFITTQHILYDHN